MSPKAHSSSWGSPFRWNFLRYYTWWCHGGHIPSVDRVYDVVGGVVRPAAAGVLGGAGRPLLSPHTLQTLASPSIEYNRLKTNIFARKYEYLWIYRLFGEPYQRKNFDIFKQGITKRCRLSWLPNSALVYEPKCGERGRDLRDLSQWVQLYTGAQINFGDRTPYLAYVASKKKISLNLVARHLWD